MMFSVGDTISFETCGSLYLGIVVSDEVVVANDKKPLEGRVWAKWAHLDYIVFMDESDVKLVEKAQVTYSPTQVGDTDDDI